MTRDLGLTRRAFHIGALGAAGAAALGPSGVEARDRELLMTNSAIYRTKVGHIRLTVLSDGQIAFPAWPTYAPDAIEADVARAMDSEFLTPPDYVLDANALLIEDGERTVLVDTGWGPFAPGVGHLRERLRMAGVEPSAVDTVVLSHIHPDHVGGLVHSNGDPSFPDARVIVTAAEAAQWRGDPDFGAMRIDDSFRPVFLGAAANVFRHADRVDLVPMTHEILPGVTLMPLPGHTHGHVGLSIESEGERLVFVGDAVHDQAFDIANPSWGTIFDSDPSQAEATRRTLLEEIASSRTRVIGYHLPFPGIGHIRAATDGWMFVPERWRVQS